MMRSIWSTRLLRYAAIPVGTCFVLFPIWAALNGTQGADVCAGIGLLFIIAMVDLKRSEIRNDRETA